MLLFNGILLIHFLSFLLYLSTLIVLFPRQERITTRIGLLLGIIILLSGIALVALKYPNVNYYKVIPKTAIFIAIAALNTIYGKRALSKNVYFTLLSLTILASVIALVRV